METNIEDRAAKILQLGSRLAPNDYQEVEPITEPIAAQDETPQETPSEVYAVIASEITSCISIRPERMFNYSKMEKAMEIGAICNTKYLSEIEKLFDYRAINHAGVMYLMQWCVDYYRKYQRAPGPDIDCIWDDPKAFMDEDTKRFLHSHIPVLSEVYKAHWEENEKFSSLPKDINLDFLCDQTKLLLRQYRQKTLLEEATRQNDRGNPDEVLKIIEKLKSDNQSDFETQFNEATVSWNEWKEIDIKPPVALVPPLFMKGFYVIIHAPRGVGKSKFVQALIVGMTREDISNVPDMAYLQFKKQAKVLYVDSEMSYHDIFTRINGFEKWLGPESKEYPIIMGGIGKDPTKRAIPDLRKPTHRQAITKQIEEGAFDVLILDNKKNMVPGLDDFNKSTEWEPINNWIVGLRNNGTLVILVVHSNKDGSLKGEFTQENNPNIIIKLEEISSEDTFTAHVEKGRSMSQNDRKPFTLHIAETEKGSGVWFWEDMEPSKKVKKDSTFEERKRKALPLYSSGMQDNKIAKALNMKASNFNRDVAKPMEKEGLIKDKTLTEKGRSLLAEWGVDDYQNGFDNLD